MKPYTEEMLLFRSEPDNRHYAKLLLTEIAEVLGETVAQHERKPIDNQIMLALKYDECWHSGQADIKEVLERDILFLSEPEKDKKQAERDEQTNRKPLVRDMEMERTR